MVANVALDHQEVPVGSIRTSTWAMVAPVLPLVLLIYSFLLLPPEARTNLFGVNLPSYRMILIPLFIQVVVSYLTGRIRPVMADFLVGAASLWTLMSFMHHYGFQNGAIRGFGTLIDSAGAYFVARACVRTPRDLRLFLLLIAPGLLLAGAEMAFESISKRLYIRPFFQTYLGSAATYVAGQEAGSIELRRDFRIGGLLRAYGNFSHPIIGGLILSSSLLMFYYSRIKGIPRLAGLAGGFFGFFALSSATIISILIAAAVIALNVVVERVRSLTWWLVVLTLSMLGLLVQMASKGGLVNVLIRQTLDPQTGYFRKLIWEYGLISVRRNPVYGIGYAEYERPTNLIPSSSVDAHFLALGIRDGVVPPVAILIAMVLILISLGRTIGRINGVDRKLLFGLNGALFGLLIGSMTVTFFSEGLIWFMAMLGIGAALGKFNPQGVNAPSASLPPTSLTAGGAPPFGVRR